MGDEAFGLGFFTPNFPGSPPPGLDSSLLPETKEEIYELLTSPLNRYTCKSKHATQWKSYTHVHHARARNRFPRSLLVDRWRNYWLHTSRGRCFEILDREFLATPRDFALIRYIFLVSIERLIKRVFLRRLRLMEDWLRSFFAIGGIYLMADWPVNVDRWRNDPEYRSWEKNVEHVLTASWYLWTKKRFFSYFYFTRYFLLFDNFNLSLL